MSASDNYIDDVAVYPFGPDADKDFYFAPPAIAQRLDLIQYLLEYSGEVVMVLGARGGGKTSMIRQLMRRTSEVWHVCHIDATAMLEARTLQRQIADAFDWTPRESELQDMERYTAGLQQQLDACEHDNLVPVIIVDNAHELPAESLILLLHLATLGDRNEQLHVALFCEPHINEMLDSPRMSEFKHNILHILEIPLFSEDQVLQYLEGRCSHAGLLGELPFSDEALDIIQQRSKGVPGRINALAHQSMLGDDLANDVGDDFGSRPPLEGLPPLLRNKTQLMMLAGLLGAVTLIVALNSMFNSVESPETAGNEADRDPLAGVDGARPTTDPNRLEESPDTAALAELEQTPVPTGVPSPIVTKPASAPTLAPTRVPTPVRATPSPTLKPKPTLAPERPQPSTPAPTRPPATQPTPQPADTTTGLAIPGVNGPEWLKQQRGNEYVLQLFGTHDQAALKRFIVTHNLRDRVAWFASNRDGKNWYVLVQGPFADHNKAVSAIQNLPAGVRTLKPWARSLSTVRDAMEGPQPLRPVQATPPPPKPTASPPLRTAKPVTKPKPTRPIPRSKTPRGRQDASD